MTFVLGLAQCRHPEEGGTEAVLEMAEQWCAEASLRGVDILVFPESLMTRYELDKRSFASEVESIDGPFCCGMNALAARYGLWLVYTVNERNNEGNPFNTAVITGSDGTMLMYGKEASNRKQEIDRQHYTIPNQRPKDKHCGKI